MKQVPYIFNEHSVTIFWDGKPYTIRKDHANYHAVEQALIDARYDDLEQHLDIARAVENFVEGDIEVKDEVVFYKGHRLHGVVVDKLLAMLRAGLKDSAPLTNFISRLQTNPSANSVNELYSFMSYKSLANTPEGKILGYKGVQSDYWSSTGNADTIVVQGETNERHQILNEVGATIEVARRCVDDNKDNHCSFGLHVGSFDYADGWAGSDGRLLLVEFDPSDAVSVPTDCQFQKLRVSKYKVISDITDTRKELNTPVYEANKPIYGSDDDVCCDDDDCDYDCDDYDNEEECDFVDMEDDDNYDLDEHGEPKVVLPEGYDDDDFDMVKTQDEEENVRNSIELYIYKKHGLGIDPTLKNIADLRICKANKVTCKKVLEIIEFLGYGIEDSEDKIFSSLKVHPQF
jgi:hypothetical protein